jgi:hypothetical protein
MAFVKKGLDPQMRYSVPYMMTLQGLLIIKRKLKISTIVVNL